ncbi:MAG TPA: hypothetical protein DC049_09265, partial [Spirochaetia bacterium]|nr:hypothetical protein [Spirochaetia bacterium]
MNEKKKKIAAYSAVSLIIAGILFYIYFFYRAYLFAFLICTGMGIITSLAAYYLFKRRFLGGLRGAMIIAVIGAVTGAFS